MTRLEQDKKEPCGDAIDRAEAIKIASGYCHPANVAKELAKLPSVNPMPCEDAISRQAVKELYYKDGYISFRKICELPSVNPQPCEDAISRQAVLDMATTIQTDDYSGNEIIEVVDVDDVKALPPVTSQPKTGRWVENDRGISICSCCGKDKYEDIDGSIYDDVWFPNYCPNCGSRMVEPQEKR